MGTDHNPLMIKMIIKLKKNKKKQMNHQMEKLLNLLKHDEYKRMYAHYCTVEVKHQYEALSKVETNQCSDLEVVERTWQILKTSTVKPLIVNTPD